MAELVGKQLEGTPSVEGQYKLNMTLFYRNVNCDGSNIVPLIEKVVLDVLQDCKIVKQDNVRHHLGSTWYIGGQDKENPRCEVIINDTGEPT